MRTVLRKVSIVAATSLSLAGGALLTPTIAQARYYHYGYGSGWVGPAIVGGFLLGALAASRPYYYGYPAYGYGYPAYGYGYPAYSYPAYGYYGGGCYLQRHVVGYTRGGRPIVRRVRVCY